MNQMQKVAALAVAAGVGGWLFMRARARASYSFAGKVVLVTGGSRGLGLVLARQLAASGARVAICARDGDELERAAAELSAGGPLPATMICDVTDPQRVRKMIDEIQDRLGPIDVLINNAGMISVGPLESMKREDFERVLAINFWGAFNTVEAVLPGMRARQEGRIVNISSIGGKLSVPHLLPYCTAKFALAGYSQGLRAELAQAGIVVTTVFPGLMRTGSPRNASFKGNQEAEYAWFKLGDSLPLLTTSAENAASAILEACARGDAEAVVSLPAQMAVLMQGVLPELTASLTSLANRLLPGNDSAGSETRLGKDCETAVTRSLLTAATDAAAGRNNEFAPTGR